MSGDRQPADVRSSCEIRHRFEDGVQVIDEVLEVIDPLGPDGRVPRVGRRQAEARLVEEGGLDDHQTVRCPVVDQRIVCVHS